jgi:hypothetical protein
MMRRMFSEEEYQKLGRLVISDGKWKYKYYRYVEFLAKAYRTKFLEMGFERQGDEFENGSDGKRKEKDWENEVGDGGFIGTKGWKLIEGDTWPYRQTER